jgi:Ca2+:H+ antiporter
VDRVPAQAAGDGRALRRRFAEFNAEGTATALATVATLGLVLPRFTTSHPGPQYSGSQLAFAAIASVALYGLFVFVQTVRHRDYFLVEDDGHAEPPSDRESQKGLGLLLLGLVAVVGLAKLESSPIEEAVGAAQSAVGALIALLVLMPEGLSAVRNARRGRVQTGFNLAFGSAMASIGLTIPAIAIASIWLDGPLVLGVDATQMVLLALTFVVGALTVLPGRATVQEGGVHRSSSPPSSSSRSTRNRAGRTARRAAGASFRPRPASSSAAGTAPPGWRCV